MNQRDAGIDRQLGHGRGGGAVDGFTMMASTLFATMFCT